MRKRLRIKGREVLQDSERVAIMDGTRMAKEYDPRMHSAEHILNQTMVRLYGCGRSFSTHIEKKKSKCDYHFGRDLTEQEAGELERLVNAVIDADMRVSIEVVPRRDAAAAFDLGRLPEGAGDSVRIVRIGDYDACPCIGEHVRTTREIGAFRIISTGHADGVLRVRFKVADPL